MKKVVLVLFAFLFFSVGQAFAYRVTDFSNDTKVVAALRVLQRAGLSDVLNNNVNEMSLLTGNNENNNNAMLNMLMGSGNSSLSPQVIQSLLTNQMSVGF